MRKMTLAIVIFVMAFAPMASISATLDPPWKCIEKKNNFEYWYDASRVTKTAQHIDVFVWEIYKKDSSTAFKHIRFERSSGLKGYGECKGYKYNKQVSDFDFSKMGFVFGKPQPEEKKLFKLLKNKLEGKRE